MQAEVKEKIDKILAGHKRAIKNPLAKVALARDPSMRKRDREIDSLAIQGAVKKSVEQYSELLPFVKGIKKHIKDIVEETVICAVYLLMCRAFHDWKALLLLLHAGMNAPALTVLRKIKEAVDIVDLFIMDADKNTSKNLEKWFSGKLLTPSDTHKSREEFEEKYSPNSDVDLVKMKSHIYQMESQSAHNGYVSILESVSPFSEDFDFDGYTDTHYARESARHIEASMTELALALRLTYSVLLKDGMGVEKIKGIIAKYNPDINDPIDTADLSSFKKKKPTS